jgi:hypothetical protein
MMDYTTIQRVKQEMHIKSGSSIDDGLLSLLVTAASRAWDRKCTGTLDVDAENYFMSGSVVGERLEAQIDHLGQEIIVYPHKPIISSVSSFTFQARIIDTSYTVAASRIEAMGPRVVAYPESLALDFPSKCRVTISYVGGIGADTASLPADMQEAVAILAARFYREAETGLADQIGVAELGSMIYTKAWPVRVTDLLHVYKRVVGWRHVA